MSEADKTILDKAPSPGDAVEDRPSSEFNPRLHYAPMTGVEVANAIAERVLAAREHVLANLGHDLDPLEDNGQVDKETARLIWRLVCKAAETYEGTVFAFTREIRQDPAGGVSHRILRDLGDPGDVFYRQRYQ